MPDPAPALKDLFDPARYRHIAKEVAAIDPHFDSKHFLKLALVDLDQLSLLQRLRRGSETLHATLSGDYAKKLETMRQLAPRINHNFVSLVLPDYVALYGMEHFDVSLTALKFFTTFGSSEFAIRPFLRQDLPRTLAMMKTWSLDENEHVRRLASEGCRPRLPWSFRLDALITDPTLALPILENLRSDPSLYVRKSVANHLNDITKDHPDLVMDLLEKWPRENPHTAWITRQALRTLIKKGNPRALGLIGASGKAEVKVSRFEATPKQIQLGQKIRLDLQFTSTADQAQRLVVDYALHYVKKNGSTSAKVFKWKEVTLAPGETLTLAREQTIKDFTTRVHHLGHHAVEIQINGETLAKSGFDLVG
jgi:3-methyladenine DNA glycosylase AlkC